MSSQTDEFALFQDICLFYLFYQSQMFEGQDLYGDIRNLRDELIGKLIGGNILKEKDVIGTNDPISDLNFLHNFLITQLSQAKYYQSVQPKQPQFQISSMETQNSSIVISCLSNFIPINQQLTKLSEVLFNQPSQPILLTKTFRTLYQYVNDASTILFQYIPSAKELQNKKTQLLAQCIELSSQIHIKQTNQTPIKKISSSGQNSSQKRQQKQIFHLKQQIQYLEDVIQQNDEQFTIQIQKYNHLVADLQQTVREYDIKFDMIRQYESRINHLEHKMIRMKEEKCRDEMLIENMARKIRAYEKEKSQGSSFIYFARKKKDQNKKPVSNLSGVKLSSTTFDFRNHSSFFDRGAY